MEDYSEQIKVIRWGKQETIDRLHVVQSIQAYGYNVLDNKVKYLNHDGPRYLWEGSNRENAVKALEALKNNEPVPPNEPQVKPARSILFREKHGNHYYSIPTLEDFKKVALLILEERKGYFFDPETVKPSEEEYALTEVDIVEEHQKLTDSIHVVLKDKAIATLETKIKSARSKINYYDKYSMQFTKMQKALEKQNGSMAIHVLTSRSEQGHEYETFEIIDPIIVE